ERGSLPALLWRNQVQRAALVVVAPAPPVRNALEHLVDIGGGQRRKRAVGRWLRGGRCRPGAYRRERHEGDECGRACLHRRGPSQMESAGIGPEARRRAADLLRVMEMIGIPLDACELEYL